MSIIQIDESKCVGCNSCIRVCPSLDANYAHVDEDGKSIISINDNMCIKCGACIKACTHGARYFVDDTDEFMSDVAAGRETALIVAPAIKLAFDRDWEDLLSYFRQRGVKLIYDVSFGADICTWVHVRYVQQHPHATIISQPCAAIVNYCLKHNHDLIKYLSPGQSPMMCTAIYMRKYMGFKGKIAAISPCIAKIDEFKQNNNVINYNVTLEKLTNYLKDNNINYRGASKGKHFTFDSPEGFVGAIYPQPAGLKENLLLHDPDMRVINSEGTARIYHELDQYLQTSVSYRPTVFDVLNCEFGCNGGPALGIEYEPFKMYSRTMDAKSKTNKARMEDSGKKGVDKQFAGFDSKLKIEDFLRSYKAENVGTTTVTEPEILAAFKSLHKRTETECHFDCHACGYRTCRDMATAIAKGHNVPENCRRFNDYIMEQERMRLDESNNAIAGISNELGEIIASLSDSINTVETYVTEIRDNGNASSEDMSIVTERMSSLGELTGNILNMMKDIDSNIVSYSDMTNSVKAIANKINLLSLNASIESARAGEAGRAFAVVAQNIRELSESSRQSVGSAEANEESIRASIDNVNATVDEFSEGFTKLVKLLEEARSKVDTLSDNSLNISASMQRVDDISKQLESIADRASTIVG
ncbi:MAG: 4Fe-4S binding protein [Lachnospiraceae bacterium]|nr:4Fe-4S binding protein [Lachnospiraceae bacterium]